MKRARAAKQTLPGKGGRSSAFKRALFSLLAEMQLCSYKMNPSYFYAQLLCYLLVLGFSFMAPNVFKTFFEVKLLNMFENQLLYMTLAYFATLVLLHACMIFIHLKKMRISGILELTVYMTTSFTYVIYPLIILLTSSIIAKNFRRVAGGISGWQVTPLAVWVLLATLLNGYFLKVKVSLPHGTSGLPVLSSERQLAVFLATAAAQFFAAFRLTAAYWSLSLACRRSKSRKARCRIAW